MPTDREYIDMTRDSTENEDNEIDEIIEDFFPFWTVLENEPIERNIDDILADLEEIE